MRPIDVPGLQGATAKGSAAVVLSALMFALAGAAGKLVADNLGTFALVFWRNLLSFVFLLAWLAAVGSPGLRTGKPGLQLLRAALSYGALLAYFLAIARAPLASAVLLQSTAPIFVPILAYLALRRLSDRLVWLRGRGWASSASPASSARPGWAPPRASSAGPPQVP